MRYFLHLCYDGTNYSGWQVQANAPSVQQTINEGLRKLLGHEIKSLGCGRTDAGVHAKDFYMHFDTTDEIADLENFGFRLNCVLPHDISIFRIIPVEEKTNARFDATERTYEYFVHFDKSPFINKYSFYQGFYQIDWQKVLSLTKVVAATEDFTSLCLPSDDFKTNLCSIKRARWDILPSNDWVLKPYDLREDLPSLNAIHEAKAGEVFRFTITANRFLRGMVRKIVGTMLMVGKGRISSEEFESIVTSKEDFRIHYLAPPNGLFLSKIRYPFLN